MNVILIGPPASGKGTQAKLISEKYNLTHVSTGDLIRNSIKNKIGNYELLESYVNNGKLVPDEIIINMLKEFLKSIDNGILLDGFPRTINQLKMLENLIEINYVFEIKVSLEHILSRINERFICEKCGKTFSIKNYTIKNCDDCGGELIKRSDDTEGKVTTRYNDYLSVTNEILQYYKNKKCFHQIDGTKSVNEVFNQICEAIDII